MAKKRDTKTTKTRTCLCCDREFESLGIWNRQCTDCRYVNGRWGGGLENLGLEQRHKMGEVRRG
jgi:hypothetical protein